MAWGGRIWLMVTSETVKAKVLRKRPEAAVLARAGARAVLVAGEARLLDPTRPDDALRSMSETVLSGAAVAGYLGRNQQDLLDSIRARRPQPQPGAQPCTSGAARRAGLVPSSSPTARRSSRRRGNGPAGEGGTSLTPRTTSMAGRSRTGRSRTSSPRSRTSPGECPGSSAASAIASSGGSSRLGHSACPGDGCRTTASRSSRPSCSRSAACQHARKPVSRSTRPRSTTPPASREWSYEGRPRRAPREMPSTSVSGPSG